MIGPDRLIDPWACRQCGEARYNHGRQYDPYMKRMHSWVQPTTKQVLYRMIRRRKWHGDTRWR